MAETEGVHLRITGDGSDAIKEVQRVINAVSNIKGAHAEINVNSDKAAQDIQKIISEIEGIRDAHINVVVNRVDTSQAIQDTNVEIKGNNEGLMRALGESERAVENVNGQKATVNVQADTQDVDKISEAVEDKSLTVDIQVQGVDKLDNISSLNPNVNVEVIGEERIESVANFIKELPDNVEVTGNLELNVTTDELDSAKEGLNQLQGAEANIHLNIEEDEQVAQVFTDIQNLNGQTASPRINLESNIPEIVDEANETLATLQNTEGTVLLNGDATGVHEAVSEAQDAVESLENQIEGQNPSVNAEFNIAVNGEQAEEEVNRVADSVLNIPDGNVNLSANTIQADQAFEEVEQRGQELEQGTFVIDGDNHQAVEAINKVQDSLDNLNGQEAGANVTVRVQTDNQALDDFQNNVNGLHGNEVTVSAEVSGTENVEELQDNIGNLPDGNSNIVVNNSQALDAIEEVVTALNSIPDRNIDIGINFDTHAFEEQLNSLANRFETYVNIVVNHEELQRSVEEVRQLVDELNNTNATVNIHANNNNALSTAQETNNAVNGINNREVQINANGEQAIHEADRIERRIQDINNRHVDIILRSHDFGRFDYIASQLAQAGARLGQNFSSAFAKNLTTTALGLDNIGQTFEGIFRGIVLSITGLATSVTGFLSLIGMRSLAIGGGFEAQMTSVKVISGATGEELDKLTAKAREMGATLPITAAQAAQAMTIMAQRGTSVKDILSSVEEITSLTISQGVDTATAAELVGSTMTNFGIAVEDIAHVTNAFNIACNSSALSMSKLVSSMKYVAPAASMIGMSLEEALAASEALANAGLPGEMIGSGLAMVITKLATKTQVAGVATRDLDGNMRSLSEIFGELKAKGAGLAELNKEFGVRGVKAAAGIMKNVEALDQMQESLYKTGVTQAAVQEKMKSWPNVWNAFQSATEELHIEIFDQIKEQAKETVSGIATLTRSLSAWIGETKIAEKSLNAFLQGLGFSVPSKSGFKQLLDDFDVDRFVEMIGRFGATFREIGDTIFHVFQTIRTPLIFLIEHLDTFAQISFWGWIVSTGLRIPLAIVNISNAILNLAGSLRFLATLNFAPLMTLLGHPLFATLVGGVALGAGIINIASHARNDFHEARVQRTNEFQTTSKDNTSLVDYITENVSTGFEDLKGLPEKFAHASEEALNDVNGFVDDAKAKFRETVADLSNALNEKGLLNTNAEKAFMRLGNNEISEMSEKIFPEKVKEIAKLKEQIQEKRNKLETTSDKQLVSSLKESINARIQKLGEVQQDLRDSFVNFLQGSLEKISISRNIKLEDLDTEELEKLKNTLANLTGIYGTRLDQGLNEVFERIANSAEIAGVATKDFEGNLRPLEDIFSDLKNVKIEDFSSTGRAITAALTQVFDIPFKERLESLFNEIELNPDDIDIDDDLATTLSEALHGSQEAYAKLSTNMQAVIDVLRETGYTASGAVSSVEEMVKAYEKLREAKSRATQTEKKSPFDRFSKELNEQVQTLVDTFPDEIEKIQSYLGNQDIEVALKLSLEQAKGNIDEFAKKASKDFSMPKEIVSSLVIERLKTLGLQGNKTAQSFVNAFGNAEKEVERFLQNAKDSVEYLGTSPEQFTPTLQNLANGIQQVDPITGRITESFKKVKSALDEWNSFTFDNFLQNARDAVEYLGVSPEKFNPALAKLANGIQKIDPITGRVTEQFKKAYAALKEWSNITFDNLANRIQKLRKAFEGGFISEESYQAQYKNLSEQLKRQVVIDLEPIKNQFSNRNDYQAVLASEFTSRLEELGGEKMLDMWRNELNNRLGDQSGQAIGAWIEQSVKNLQNTIQPLQTQAQVQSSLFDFQGFSQALSPITQRLETFTAQPPSDYSATFSQVISALQNVSTNVLSVKSAIEVLDGTVKAINIQELSNTLMPLVNKTDVSVAESPLLSYEPIVNEIRNIASVIQGHQTETKDYSQIITEIQAVRERINSLENTVKSSNTFDETNILSGMQEIRNSVSSLEGVLRSLSVGNNFDIDINQDGFVVQQRSDADNIAQLTSSALRSGIGNGVI